MQSKAIVKTYIHTSLNPLEFSVEKNSLAE
jgi:hypothetical protein